MKQVKARVISKGKPIKGIRRTSGRSILYSQVIKIRCPEIASEAKPGQFVMVKCGSEPILPRPFSIHQINNDGITIFYAVLEDGKGTNWLSSCEIEDEIKLYGPLGNGYFVNQNAVNILLLAGGMGIASLYFLAEDSIKKEKSVKMLYGTAINAGYEVPKNSGINLVSATEDGSVGYHGMITDLIPEHIEWADQVFACGPVGMYRAMAQMPELKGKPVQVSLEVRMGCGRGICYGCTIKTKNGLKRVCEDGPVFDLHEVIWDSVKL